MAIKTIFQETMKIGKDVFKRAERGLFAGKQRLTGNNVSFSERKTRRVWKPNVQTKTFYSQLLDQRIRLKVTTHAIRCIERKGGLDEYLLNTKVTSLQESLVAMKLRGQLLEKQKSNALQNPNAAHPQMDSSCSSTTTTHKKEMRT
jgi:large subunit ribosomal protein L28